MKLINETNTVYPGYSQGSESYDIGVFKGQIQYMNSTIMSINQTIADIKKELNENLDEDPKFLKYILSSYKGIHKADYDAVNKLHNLNKTQFEKIKAAWGVKLNNAKKSSLLLRKY